MPVRIIKVDPNEPPADGEEHTPVLELDPSLPPAVAGKPLSDEADFLAFARGLFSELSAEATDGDAVDAADVDTATEGEGTQ